MNSTSASRPISEYTVKKYPHGIAVFGSIDLETMADVIEKWASQGFMWVRSDIAQELGAAIVVVKSTEEANAWRKDLGIRADHPDWLKSGDTGLSSRTIFATFTNRWEVLQGGKDDARPPLDSDDFGRCHRLLLRYPGWKADLGRICEVCPGFGPLVAVWPELEAMFVAGQFKELTLRMYSLARAKRSS
jgi:hypothetical protein